MKPTLFLVDTSAWIYVLGARPVVQLRERVSELILKNQVAITTPVVFELLRGVRTEDEGNRLKLKLKSLRYYPFSSGDWVEAAKWANALAKHGLNPKSMDVLIAFKALEAGLLILHADKDFEQMARLSSIPMESWLGRV